MKELIKRKNYVRKSINDNYPKFIISTDIITSEIEGIEHINIVNWLLNN